MENQQEETQDGSSIVSAPCLHDETVADTQYRSQCPPSAPNSRTSSAQTNHPRLPPRDSALLALATAFPCQKTTGEQTGAYP